MAHKSFSYKGYDIYLASAQPSKKARGGYMRTMQVCLPNGESRQIKKSIRYDTRDVYAFSEASKKAIKWIDNQTNNNMRKIKVGDKLKAIFTQPLPGNDVAPPLKHGIEYECQAVHTDKQGNDHIDVGLVRSCNWVTSYATGETLPGTAHWCHPNRFIIDHPKNV